MAKKKENKVDSSLSIPLLMTLGISKVSAELYVSLVACGPLTITELARKHALSRTTTYEYMEELLEKDLCTKKKSSQKIESISLDKLHSRLEASILEAHTDLEEILSHAKHKDIAPTTEVSQGKNAISLVFKDIGLSLPKGGTYFRYTSRKEDFIRDPTYTELRKKKEIERLVITSVSKALSKKDDANRFMKTVPKDFAFDDNVSVIIYGDKVVHIDHATATVITIASKPLAHFQEKIFKLLWKRL